MTEKYVYEYRLVSPRGEGLDEKLKKAGQGGFRLILETSSGYLILQRGRKVKV